MAGRTMTRQGSTIVLLCPVAACMVCQSYWRWRFAVPLTRTSLFRLRSLRSRMRHVVYIATAFASEVGKVRRLWRIGSGQDPKHGRSCIRGVVGTGTSPLIVIFVHSPLDLLQPHDFRFHQRFLSCRLWRTSCSNLVRKVMMPKQVVSADANSG